MASTLRGTIRLPADKSIAQRALLFTSMARGSATITMHDPGADVLSTLNAMRTLGAVTAVENSPTGTVTVQVTGGDHDGVARLPGISHLTIDCGNSGTLMRLLTGASLTRGGLTLTGDESLSSRPMERVAEPLREFGAAIVTTEGHAPIHIGSAPLEARQLSLPVASAQVLGASILAATGAEGISRISVPGPTRDHTERLLAFLGADVHREGLATTVHGPASWKARDITVPADPSAAAFWLVAGAIHPDAEISLPGVGLNPTRIAFIDVLQRMGADIEISVPPTDGPEPTGDVTVRSGRRLNAVEIDGDTVADVIDELPVLAVAMAAAEGTSTVSGAQELRVKESDRIRLVVDMLHGLGIAADELPDGWTVTGSAVRVADSGEPPAFIRTAGDHRIAMAAAIADLAGVGERGARVDDEDCTAISYPSFWTDGKSLQ